MVTHPISVARSYYRGNDPKKRAKRDRENTVAALLESKINEMLLAQDSPVRAYVYHEIALATGVDIELVRKLCYSIDCGSNGFTAIKPGMTLEQLDRDRNKGIVS
jgi:hypothetical protein